MWRNCEDGIRSYEFERQHSANGIEAKSEPQNSASGIEAHTGVDLDRD
jgi:hypothetical protein